MTKKKKILFVCVENSCRSQMAEGWARHLGKDVAESYSAGSRPSGAVNPEAVEVMREVNIDISRQQSKGLDNLPVKEFDYAVTMGCGDTCPFVVSRRRIDWKIDDPKGKGQEAFRRARNEIAVRVERLLNEIKCKGE